VIYQNVQDLTHPAISFRPSSILCKIGIPNSLGVWRRLETAHRCAEPVSEIEFGEFRVELRNTDPNWKDNWRQHGDQFSTRFESRHRLSSSS